MAIIELEINLRENLHKIVMALESEKNMKRTHIAKAMGYTTTTQLSGALGMGSLSSSLSTKAIVQLIRNLHVNPTFLFLGEGSMFLGDSTDLENLQIESAEWERKYHYAEQERRSCKYELEKAVRRYNKLIDITSIALEKTQQSDTSTEESQEEK